MRAFVTINQMAFSQISDSRKIKLDLIDATIFEYIYKFAVSNKAMKQIINDKLYIWCSYKKIIDDNPLINISSKRAIENRLNKLVKIGLLSKFTDKKKGNKTFFNVTDLAYTLVIENTNLSHHGDKGVCHRDDYNSKLYNRELDNNKENIKEKIDFLKYPNINQAACIEWLGYKRYKNKAGITKTLNFLNKYSKNIQQEIVNVSIMNEWKGLFPPKKQYKQKQTLAERNREAIKQYAKEFGGTIENDCIDTEVM